MSNSTAIVCSSGMIQNVQVQGFHRTLRWTGSQKRIELAPRSPGTISSRSAFVTQVLSYTSTQNISSGSSEIPELSKMLFSVSDLLRKLQNEGTCIYRTSVITAEDNKKMVLFSVADFPMR